MAMFIDRCDEGMAAAFGVQRRDKRGGNKIYPA